MGLFGLSLGRTVNAPKLRNTCVKVACDYRAISCVFVPLSFSKFHLPVTCRKQKVHLATIRCTFRNWNNFGLPVEAERRLVNVILKEVIMNLLIKIYLLFTYLFTFDEDDETDCHIGCTKNCEHCIYDAK